MEQPSPAANTGTLYSLAFSRITILEARPRANLGQPTLAANTGIFFIAGLISKTTILETHLWVNMGQPSPAANTGLFIVSKARKFKRILTNRNLSCVN